MPGIWNLISDLETYRTQNLSLQSLIKLDFTQCHAGAAVPNLDLYDSTHQYADFFLPQRGFSINPLSSRACYFYYRLQRQYLPSLPEPKPSFPTLLTFPTVCVYYSQVRLSIQQTRNQEGSWSLTKWVMVNFWTYSKSFIIRLKVYLSIWPIHIWNTH